MKRLLTYGLLLLTILASHFVVSACQDDLPETTEVMLTFTTRADLSFEDDEYATDSDLQDVDRMKDLRVIMLDGENKVVGNAIKEDINKSSVVFKFSTPASHGEVFKFLAIANENSIDGLGEELSKIVDNQDFSSYENSWKKREIRSTLNPTAENPLPQTKFWTWTYSVFGDGGEDLKPVLDYVGCKISVQFKNETNKAQSLSNIYIAGVGRGYLFKQDENDFVSDAPANINLSPINDLPANESSEVQHCYTYPKGNISSPTLFATWNGVQYSLTLKDNQGNALTALNRNDYLQIVVTLTDVGLDISYVIAEWVNNQPTYIGQSPSIGDDGYDIPEWGDGTDVNIGGNPIEPDEPGSGGGDAPIGGSVLWTGEETLEWQNNIVSVLCESFNDLDYTVTTDYKIRVSFNAANSGAQLQFTYVSGVMGIPELGNSNSTMISEGATSFEFTLNATMLENFLNKDDSAIAFNMIGEKLTITEVLLFLPTTE